MSKAGESSSNTSLLQDSDRSLNWEVVLRSENKVVLYSAGLNALKVDEGHLWIEEEPYQVEIESGTEEEDSENEEDELLEVIQASTSKTTTTATTTTANQNQSLNICPLCLQLVPRNDNKRGRNTRSNRRYPTLKKDASYFTLLSQANSRAGSPRSTIPTSTMDQQEEESISIEESVLNQGYFASFFKVIQHLGKGGSGTVELVNHVLNGEKLGLYACKRIAVGDSSPSLLRILREVHLLEGLQHPNVVSYHHTWLENVSLTTFGPKVPTLHILMGYANGGSLDDFVIQRRGGIDPGSSSGEGLSRSERIRLFRMRKFGVVHLLRLDEILDLFEDVVEGLAFLHNRNILHLDMKAANVLLHWEDDALLPRAKLSDFGSSENTTESWQRERTGGSGTLDWMPPESWEHDIKTGKLHSPNRSTDQWGLGLILHLLSFFCLPYRNEVDSVALEQEIRSYPGFFIADAHSLDHGTRHDLPHGLLRLMSLLINRNRSKRPSCEEVLSALRLIRADFLVSPANSSTSTESTLVLKQRTPSPSPNAFLLSSSPKTLNHSSRSSDSSISTTDTAVISELRIPKSEESLEIRRFHKPSRNKYRSNRNQIQLVIVLAILKALSIQNLCYHSISPFALYALLLPSLIDWFLLDWRISIVLAIFHLGGMRLARGEICA